MCTYSIHEVHRKAGSKERLQVRGLRTAIHVAGLYPTAGSDERLVCVAKGTQAIIKKVQLLPQHLMRSPEYKKYDGKRNLKVTFGNRYGHFDALVTENGTKIPLYMLAMGVRIDIGIPVRKRKPAAKKITGDKGVAMIKQALTEVTKTKEIVTKAGARKRTVRRVKKTKA